MTHLQPTPAEALEAVRQSRRALGDRLQKPHWYRFVYGLAAACLPIGFFLQTPYDSLVFALSTVMIAIAYRSWVRATGVSVLGLTPPRARWVSLSLALSLVLILVGVVLLRRTLDLWWAPLAGAAAAFAAAWTLSGLWVRVYRHELSEGL